nr:hypothetical protein [Tanacetum cinerariifolium]
MKNLNDAFTFGGQFIDEKSTEDELGKANVDTEVESMVTIPIYQASSAALLLSIPIIDITLPKHVSPPVQAPIIIATNTTTTTTTTLLPPPPLQQQNTTDPELANHVSSLEDICANLAKKNKLSNQITQALSSRIFTVHEATSKSRKRRHDDQDPPSPPPKDSDHNKKKRHDSDASASKQSQALTSLA